MKWFYMIGSFVFLFLCIKFLLSGVIDWAALNLAAAVALRFIADQYDRKD